MKRINEVPYSITTNTIYTPYKMPITNRIKKPFKVSIVKSRFIKQFI